MSTLSDYLDAIEIPYTQEYAEGLTDKHPFADNMLGLYQMLREYNIHPIGIRSNDKSFDNLPCPFIAHMGISFVVVTDVKEDAITYLWEGKKETFTREQFLQHWSGNALLGEVTEDSVEPDYKQHISSLRRKSIIQYAIVALSFLFILVPYVSMQSYMQGGNNAMMVLSVVGAYICYLLLKKQKHLYTAIGDKICSLFSHKDCTHILDSQAAHLWGFSWCEIGIGYFVANILLLGLYPQLLSYILWCNIATLPYTVWSIAYQRKVKSWCMLCVVVQIILWSIFLSGIFFSYSMLVGLSAFSLQGLLFTGACYVLCVLITHVVAKHLFATDESGLLQRQLVAIKANEQLFLTALKLQPYYAEAEEMRSCIQWGNPEASLRITILSNPHCNPCVRMHRKIDALLRRAGDKLSVQYFLSSFNEELLESNRILVGIMKRYSQDEALHFFNEWYERGKNTPQDFYANHPYDSVEEAVEVELALHARFKEQTNLQATPTVLINGYLKPTYYDIEDLFYHTETIIN